MSAYNYAAAFLAFSQGASFDDIAIRLGIPPETLKSEARQHGWKRMSNALDKPVQELSSLELSLVDIQKNRLQSMKDAAPLELLLSRTLDLYNRWWDELGISEENYKAHAAVLDGAIEDALLFYTPEKRREWLSIKRRFDRQPSDEDQEWLDNYGELQRSLDEATANATRAKDDRDELRKCAAPSPKALAEMAKAVATIHDIRYRAVGDLANKGSDDIKRVAAQIIVNMPRAIAHPREKRAIEIRTLPVEELGDGT